MVMARNGNLPKLPATWSFGAVYLLYKGHMIQMLVVSGTSDYTGVRCTIYRSLSTPCKKAEFQHLQIFPGHCLDFFLHVSGKICNSPIKKVKRQPTLIISFSQHSPFFWEQSKNSGWNAIRVIPYLGSVLGSL